MHFSRIVSSNYFVNIRVIISGSMSQIRNKIPVKDNLNKIENSINAVRCWSEVKENKLSKKIDSDSDSDNFEKFLTKIKSNKKPIKRSSEEDSDKNFVVPDDKLSSDEFGEYSDEDVPILSLRDRILSKNKKTPHARTLNMVKKIPRQFGQWNSLETPICLNMPLVLKKFLGPFLRKCILKNSNFYSKNI